ncbi:MAG: outer membrane beta-barrel protein [Gemmatimonadaceae bacterium]|nr:outer membrane beta-barrel protein [Gemmatimonadaceae bacterium]
MRPFRSAAPFLAACLLLGIPAPAHAQLGAGDGFLFRTPTVRLGVAAGLAAPRARSDIFDFITDELTLSRGDFASPAFTLTADVRVRPRLHVGVSAEFAGRTADSESRDFTGEDDLPILQSTTLDRAAVLATARIALAPAGRAIGRYAWIPNRVVPYVGAGAGPVWYRLRQSGEFVDRETLDIFEDQFESSGWSLGASGFGGADISVTPRYGVSLEGRYLWAKGSMNGDFSTYNKIDLSGYNASIGLFVRF